MKSRAQSFIGLVMALVCFSVISSGVWKFVILGIAVLILAFLFVLVLKKPTRLVEIAVTMPVGHFTIFLGLVALGITLLQNEQVILGFVVLLVAYLFLGFVIGQLILKAWSYKKRAKGIEEIKKSITRPFPRKDPDVILKTAMDRQQQQQTQIDSLDVKLGSLLGFGSVLFSILVGSLLALSLTVNDMEVNQWAWVMLGLSGGIYLLLVPISLRAYFPIGWQSGPNLYETWQRARKDSRRELGWWIAESFTNCYENNQNMAERKAWLTSICIWLIAIETITLAAGLIVIILS